MPMVNVPPTMASKPSKESNGGGGIMPLGESVAPDEAIPRGIISFVSRLNRVSESNPY
jgi:hypothetical protein